MNVFRVDSHQHFWDISRFEYFWMTPQVEILRRNFLPQDLESVIAELGVERTIVVQAHHSLAESRWLLELATENEFVAGVVTWVDLRSALLAKDLDELQRHPKFKGVRHLTQEEPDGWLLYPDVLASLGELARRGIPYELAIRPKHLKDVVRLRERCPQLRLVVDHLAKPTVSKHEMDPWALDMEALAQLPDVWCKLSGMITEANWQSWTAADLRPYVAHVVRCFGYDRLMFGSDWPVCLLAGSYQQVMDVLTEVLGPLSTTDNTKVWGGNACRCYQLSETSSSSSGVSA